MTLEQAPQRFFEGTRVEAPAELHARVVVVESGRAIQVALKQHPGLQHRQRIRVFDVTRHSRAVFARDQAEWTSHRIGFGLRSEEHTSELQSHSFISYAVF